MIKVPLEQHLNIPVTTTLGSVVERTDIKSSLGPFRTLPDYITTYPKNVVNALSSLYVEYNRVFTFLVAANREWETDYRYCMVDSNGSTNWCVQIDMVGLPESFLKQTSDMSEETIRNLLRHQIFEIENSIAMYQLLENLFPRNGCDSFFKTHFRAMLNSLRQRFGNPIALLAVTKPKYDAMLETEFGKCPGEPLTDEEVKELSGFDTFFSPEQFRNYLDVNNGQCKHLLYTRSSDPVDKLKNPDIVVDHPLLSNTTMRQAIKTNTLTLNVDAPEMEYARRINDTKEYMPKMGMAFPITSIENLYSSQFGEYLRTQGVNPDDVTSGRATIRCKPAKGTYGCYGHVSGVLNGDSRNKLKRNIRRRGHYLVQPEMATPTITNMTNGTKYTFIDRNFFGIVNGHPEFLGGVRNLVPVETDEAREGRIHGNSSAVYAEIVG